MLTKIKDHNPNEYLPALPPSCTMAFWEGLANAFGMMATMAAVVLFVYGLTRLLLWLPE